jgi:hypothetical protein
LRARLRHAEAVAAQHAQQAARANYIVVALLTQIGDAILTPDTTKAVDAAIARTRASSPGTTSRTKARREAHAEGRDQWQN